MQPIARVDSRLADVYWLAFLLTGDHDASVEAAVDAVDLRAGAQPFFSTWVLRWSRKISISKALAAVRDDLHASAQRTEARLAGDRAPKLRNRSLSDAATKVDLERTLLAMDVFPRCVLVLSILEGLPVEDVAILLDADRGLVEKALASALDEFTRRLSSTRLQVPDRPVPGGLGEFQNA